LARGSPHDAVSIEPCGWKNGSLPDPAETRRCLAERFDHAKGKPEDSGGSQPRPANPPVSQPAH
jgi:hypothetical protein